MRAFDSRTKGDREAVALDGLQVIRAQSTRLTDGLLDLRVAQAVPDFPLKIQIQTFSRCNAACEMCPYPEITGEEGFDHTRMDDALYVSLLEQMEGRGVERLSLFLMNEPLLDRRLPRWLTMARRALPETKFGLFSNGAALSEPLLRALAEAGLDELCISVHGFEKALYERVMRKLVFERTLANLEMAVGLHAAGELQGLHLQIVTGDVPDVTATLASMPAALEPYVVLKGFSNERTVSEVRQGLGSSPQAERRNHDRRPLCQRPFVKLYIMTDGECVLCNCDWRRRIVLGNARETTLDAIWKGAKYAAVRRRHMRDQYLAHSICERCDYPWVVDTL
jgi:radical SAM protein with 4Fe4S-binding SPASM domain